MHKLKPLIAALTALGMAGCATDYQHQDAAIGAGIGAVLGAVAGKQASRADGAPYVGAVIGAIAGGSVGGYMDKQREDLKKKLAEEERRRELAVSQLASDTIKIGVASDASFDVGSSTLSPAAQATFAKIAATLKDYDKTVIHVVGHTDTLGTAENNQALSDRRAQAVGDYLASQGVVAGRVREEGRGERELAVRTADNVNEPRNRRVDIVIKAVVEGNEQAAWTPPPYLGG